METVKLRAAYCIRRDVAISRQVGDIADRAGSHKVRLGHSEAVRHDEGVAALALVGERRD
jgi:hypothetical protein